MNVIERLQRVDRSSAELAATGVALPLLLVSAPLQPIRALATVALVLVLPGLATVRLVGLRDVTLVLVTVPAVSLAATVIVATALMYAHAWTWQLTVILLGAATALTALAVPPATRGGVPT